MKMVRFINFELFRVFNKIFVDIKVTCGCEYGKILGCNFFFIKSDKSYKLICLQFYFSIARIFFFFLNSSSYVWFLKSTKEKKKY